MTQAGLNLNIPGYCIVSQLYKSSKTIVYRAVETNEKLDKEPRSVVIKISQQEYPTFNDLVKLRNEYAIAKNLDIPGIVRPYSLEVYKNGYILVMEDFGGISLDQYKTAKHLSLSKVLEIALQLTDILHDLYQHRIIHKDIKPANILIHPETKQVKLIDFSIASLLPRESQEIQNPNILEGTLAYLAPEQTGRMNRGIDYRSDFYALGVTLYELLTGQLPFSERDPIDLIHCHLAKIAPPVDRINPNVPKVVAQIVAKLMAKNAEDRYQSALGLKRDLQRCSSEWEEKNEISEFAIAKEDRCARFLIPEKLYGREAEVQMLLEAFDRIADGASELILVAGFSGIGKTSVINEVHKPIVRQRGYLIEGKFDQFNRNIPFSAFVQAFRSLMGQLWSESNLALEEWKRKILDAVGENGQVIIDVIPELVRVIGQQPAVPKLSGRAAQNRFNWLFGKFIRVFTSKDHPLVIFLDDLQWGDSASLNLLKLLMRESDLGYLLVLGAYRDNETFPKHPLILSLNEIRQSGTNVSTIAIEALSIDRLNQLVSDTLLCQEDVALPLTELIYQKTKGNPFFATQFLQGLYEDGSIVFDASVGSWQWDLVRVSEAALNDDVVAFMARRLQKLAPKTQDVLKLAACLGNKFDLQTLALASNRSELGLARDLWEALQEELVLPISEAYKFFHDGEERNQRSTAVSIGYRFLHDRVQQAAYSLIPQQEKQAFHLEIGRLLLSKTPETQLEESLFTIVSQLNLARKEIVEPKERKRLAQLNLSAGRKAKFSTAYGPAIDYFLAGIEVLPKNCWKRSYDLSLALHEEIAEAAFLYLDFERMEYWANLVLQHAKTLLDTIKVQQTRLIALKAQGKLLESIELGLQVLKSLGVDFPDRPTQTDIEKAFAITRQLWQDKATLSLLDLPPTIDPQILATMQMMTVMVPSAYGADPLLMSLLIFKQVQLSIECGNCPVAVFAYVDCGLILCGPIGDYLSGYEFGQLGLALLDRLEYPQFKSRAWYVFYTYIKHWKSSLHESIPCLQEAYQSGLETGDLESCCLNAVAYCKYKYHTGAELTELAEEMDCYLQTIERFKQTSSKHFLEIYRQTVLNLLGEAEIPHRTIGTVLNEEEFIPVLQAANNRTALFFLYFNQTVLSYLFGRDREAAEKSILAEGHLDSGTGTFMIPLYFFYDALIKLALFGNVSEERQCQILATVEMCQTKLQEWANLAPCNHQQHWEIVEAEKHRVLGNKTEAIELYDRAIANAKTNQFLQEEALANELAAKFYLDWGKDKVAAGYMQEAYYCYSRWGAKAKTDDLERRYPQLLSPILQQKQQSFDPLETLTAITLGVIKGIDPRNISQTFDLAAVVQSAQTLSSTLELEELIEQLTQIILKTSGAQICVLVLPDDRGVCQIKAIAQADSIPLVWENLPQPLETSTEVPVNLICWSKNTGQSIAFDAKKTLTIFDEYLSRYQPKSFFCLPILRQGVVSGIVYLEHRHAADIFIPQRQKIIEFLCTQAAIALDNAKLYQKIQQSERRARKLFDEASDAIILQAEGQIFDCNQAALDLFGISKKEILTTNLVQLSPEYQPDGRNSAQKLDRIMADLFEGGCNRFEWLHQRPNGQTFWAEIAMTLLEDRGQILTHCLVRNINDRKQTEADFAASKSNYYNLIQSINGVVWEYDIQTNRFIFVSDKAKDLLGYPVEDWLSQPNFWYDRVYKEDRYEASRIFEKAIADCQNCEFEYRLVTADERVIWVYDISTLIYNDLGQPTASKGLLIDISDRKQAESNLRQTNERLELVNRELERATKLKDEFLATMSHELRTPLNAILGMSEALQEEIFGPLNERQLRSISTIERSGQHLLELINDILDVSKIAAGKLELKIETVSIAQLCNSSLTFIKQQILAKEIRLDTYLPTDLDKIAIDERRMRQVLINLLDNAVKFTPAGGRITLEVTSQLRQATTDSSFWLHFAVTDTGIGIAASDRAKIFQPFIQIDSSLNRKYEGTGLGLTLVKQIVELHGGSISVQSELGQGSCFTVSLPQSNRDRRQE